jgi:hypothetical protein
VRNLDACAKQNLHIKRVEPTEYIEKAGEDVPEG